MPCRIITAPALHTEIPGILCRLRYDPIREVR
jgi:hypothetical protein